MDQLSVLSQRDQFCSVPGPNISTVGMAVGRVLVWEEDDRHKREEGKAARTDVLKPQEKGSVFCAAQD